MPIESPIESAARRAVDVSPSMLAYWGPDGRCRFANRAYEAWYGAAAPGALVGRSFDEVLGSERMAFYREPIERALQGQAQTFERIAPDGDGVGRHGLVQLIPDMAGGTVVGLVVQITEISALRRAEEALRTEQAHARRLAELLRERDRMIGVLAHEVRQPLNNALAALQWALDEPRQRSDAEIDNALLRAKAVMGQVLGNIDNTLAVASLLNRSRPIVRQDQDLDLLFTVVIADMPRNERGRVRVERRSATRTLSMDLGLMRLALRNLLSNALRHGPSGTPVIIRVADSDEPLALLIDVIDVGAGFEPGVQPRLFTQGDRSAAASGEDRHGLGLFVAYRAIELHGGQLLLQRNEPGAVTMRAVLPPAPLD